MWILKLRVKVVKKAGQASDSARGVRRRGGLTEARCDVGKDSRDKSAPVPYGHCD
jgi:hypothetical protein